MTPRLSPASPLLLALRRAGAAAPLTRKILVAPSINWARELLRQLARQDGGWIGWEAMTLRGIAGELAFLPLSEVRRRPGTDIEIGALVGEMLDQAAGAGAISVSTRELAASPGFRRALQDALLQLRIAGISGAQLRTVSQSQDPAADLATVLDRYEATLLHRPFTDTAGVFAAALSAFDQEAPLLLTGTLCLAPDLTPRGLPGVLLRRLLGMGAAPLESGPVEPPVPGERDCFLAATPNDEVREVLRRVVQEGLRLDEVELVATDVDTYGSALDSISRQMEFPVTLLQGLPLARSRMGRALDRWFAWLDDGLPADLLRQMLESGDLHMAEIGTDGPTLSRALRSLRIGWGRQRYESAVALLQSPAWATGYRYETEADAGAVPAERILQRTQVGADLALFLTRLLEFTPAVPERGDVSEAQVRVADLAAATLQLLALVPDEGQSTDRLRFRLQQIAEVVGPVHRFGAALAGLREGLADFRVWSDGGGAGHPWSSRGGALHLTDLVHAGLTGRQRVFVLGLDAERAAGPAGFPPVRCPTACEWLSVRNAPAGGERAGNIGTPWPPRWPGLRGEGEPLLRRRHRSAGRRASPAPALLEVIRQATGRPILSYSELRDAARRSRPRRCAAPRGCTGYAGRWLGALPTGRCSGTVLPRSWPSVAADRERASAALPAREQPASSPLHGSMLADRPQVCARPTGTGGFSLAASRRWLAVPWPGSTVRPRGSRSRRPGVRSGPWLDPLARGALLHAIYEVSSNGSCPARTPRWDLEEAAGAESSGSSTSARSSTPGCGAATQHDRLHRRGGRAPAGRAVISRACSGSIGAPVGVAARWSLPSAAGPPPRSIPWVPDSLPIRGQVDRIDRLAGRLAPGHRLQDRPLGLVFERTTRPVPSGAGAGCSPPSTPSPPKSYAGARVARSEYSFPTPAGTEPVGGILRRSWNRPRWWSSHWCTRSPGRRTSSPPTIRRTASSATSRRSAARRWTSGITSPRPSRSGPPITAGCCRPSARCAAGGRAASAPGDPQRPRRTRRPGPHQRATSTPTCWSRRGPDRARPPRLVARMLALVDRGDPGGAPRRRDLHPQGCRRAAGAVPGRSRQPG